LAETEIATYNIAKHLAKRAQEVHIITRHDKGLPVVTTKVGGLPEIIKDVENGFLVEPRNPVKIAEKCALLLTDDELRASISRNNREKAKNYSWERVVEKLEKVYLACLMGTKAKKG
jgi:glycosyltransferase involved in cell wall biosynthesis